MAVAFVMDFAGGTREQYDQVVERMQLGGRVAPGGLAHAAGQTADGWRVVDVWESAEAYQRFAEERIMPLTAEAGLQPPDVRSVELHKFERGPDADVAVVQVVGLDIDAAVYDAVRADIADPLPEGVVWHAAGPAEDGWCIVDAWASAEARDRFLSERVPGAMKAHRIPGPPRIEDLDVQATLRS
jgi:hypothetical protein